MDIVTLECGAMRATVALCGAELQSWSVEGRELLWHGDARFWAARAPVLFPVVGWTREGRVRVGGNVYPLGLHGFARTCLFEPVSIASHAVCLRLAANDETRALYPFEFVLDVIYRLGPEGLSAELLVRNAGEGPMPYAAGLHPGFRWPLPGAESAAHRVTFAQAEEPFVPVIAPGGLFSDRKRPIALNGRDLPLAEDSFTQEALCFLGANSRALRFEGGGAALDVTFENLPNIVLWSRPGAPFLCIEGWSGMGDPEGFEGELFDKPGMALLAPGGEGRHAMRFGFSTAA